MGGNFKVRALKTVDEFFNVGDIIEFKNGVTIWNDDEPSCFYESFERLTALNGWEDALELIDEEGENKVESEKGNFKVKCLDVGGYNIYYTKGKVYEVIDGVFTYDNGDIIRNITSFDDLNIETSAMWEIIEDSSDLRELLRHGYVVEHIDGKLSKVEINEDEKLIISGAHFYPIKIDLNEDLNYDKGLGFWAGSGIKTIYGFSKYNSDAFEVSTSGRKVIWKREEKSPTQLEIESIELEQRKLADRLTKLKENV